MGLLFTLGLVFVRISMIHQILEHLFHRDTYLLYILGIPVIISLFSTRALSRAYSYRAAYYWSAFAIWLIPTSIVSTWRSGSISLIADYYRTDLILLFAIGGLITNWKEFRLLMYAISVAALTNVLSMFFLRQIDENGRLSLTFSTVANSNDYSAHLIFVMPFLLWVTLVEKSKYIRTVAVLALCLGLYEILAAGSRGAFLGILAAVLCLAVTSTWRIRFIVAVSIPIVIILMMSILPANVSRRILTFELDSQLPSEAMESANDRKQVLKDSMAFAMEHPLFGLGPGQFSENEGKRTTKRGNKLWLEAHNSFAQVASENGFLGLILYLGGLFSTLVLVNNIGQSVKRVGKLREIASTVICTRLSLISFSVAIFFVNFAYFFYLPTIAGTAIALAVCAEDLRAGIPLRKRRKPKQPTNPLLELTRES